LRESFDDLSLYERCGGSEPGSRRRRRVSRCQRSTAFAQAGEPAGFDKLAIASSACNDVPTLKPTPEQGKRASWALVPFVEEWNLSLNPEELDELSYAVLRHFDSDASWKEIHESVREQIEEYRRRNDLL